jgi:hypothetical protein
MRRADLIVGWLLIACSAAFTLAAFATVFR